MSLGLILLVLVIYVLAVARVTRLVNYDSVLDGLRVAVGVRARSLDRSEAERGRWAAVEEFLGCAWCVGWWVSLAGAPVVVIVVGWSWWAVLPISLACSYLVGLVAPVSADEFDIEAAG
jgi:hypothetical protein